MYRNYRLPIMGTVIKDTPLQGAETDPICSIPVEEIEGYEELSEEDKAYAQVCDNYDLDNELVDVVIDALPAFHQWLEGALPSLQRKAEWKFTRIERY